MLITGPFGSGKTSALLNLIQKQDNEAPIDRIYLYAKDLSKPKYQFLIIKREDAGIKYLIDRSVFTEYSNTMDNVYNNIDDYNPKRKRKILFVFDDMIADIMTNKRFQAIIKEPFIRCRKLNISLIFITQSYFSVPKEVRLISTHYLIMKIHNRLLLIIQQILTTKIFFRIYRNCINEPYSFLTIDTALPADNPMKFRKTFSDSSL